MDKKALQQAQMEAKERLKAMGLLQEVEKEVEPSQEEALKQELAQKDQKIQELNDDLIQLGEKLVKSQEALAASEAKVKALEEAAEKTKKKAEKATEEK